jgi:X-Pro dipeptidyl-peptidase
MPAPTPYADYPNPAASSVTFYPSAGGNSVGSLSTTKLKKTTIEQLLDDVSFDAPSLAKASESPNRLLFATPELSTPLHLSGTARVTLKLASSTAFANLSVYLVQLPWTDGPISPANLITRGWADPQNAKSLKGGDYHSLEKGTPLKSGEYVTLSFDLQPDDQIIPAGKKIALMVLSSDRDFTLWPKPGTKLSVDLSATQITLPIVGGEKAYIAAVKK